MIFISPARWPRTSPPTSFPATNDTAKFIFVLFGFAAGFAVRPFGALFFGRLGDLIGRKYTFLDHHDDHGPFDLRRRPAARLCQTIGYAAPTLFIVCRLLQGLALGGEYGGAATYVAEHAPHGRRGFYTSWIQTTATVGLFLSLLVILALRLNMSPEAFAAWGWRVPFLLSIILLGFSIWIRLQLQESPAFQKMKAEGTRSKAPLTEAFGRWDNAKIAIIALFGGTAGQAVVWYTRAVLRAVLPDADAEGRRHDGQPPDRLLASHRHAVLHLLRLAVGQDRPQADPARRLPDRGGHLFPAVRHDRARSPIRS